MQEHAAAATRFEDFGIHAPTDEGVHAAADEVARVERELRAENQRRDELLNQRRQAQEELAAFATARAKK